LRNGAGNARPDIAANQPTGQSHQSKTPRHIADENKQNDGRRIE